MLTTSVVVEYSSSSPDHGAGWQSQSSYDAFSRKRVLLVGVYKTSNGLSIKFLMLYSCVGCGDKGKFGTGWRISASM